MTKPLQVLHRITILVFLFLLNHGNFASGQTPSPVWPPALDLIKGTVQAVSGNTITVLTQQNESIKVDTSNAQRSGIKSNELSNRPLDPANDGHVRTRIAQWVTR